MLQQPICKDRTQMAKFQGLNSPKEVDFPCKSPLKGHTMCEFTPVLVPGCRRPTLHQPRATMQRNVVLWYQLLGSMFKDS